LTRDNASMPARTPIVSSLSAEGLARLAARQCRHLIDDGDAIADDALLPLAHKALARVEHCFSHVANRYFFDGKQVCFDHLHGDQYAMWLYLLSRQAHEDGAPAAWCKKLFLLNKALHGCDIFYEVELPSVFLLVHPLGTVLGRGRYGDFFIAYQRCGIGSNRDIYPTLGRHVTLRPGAAVLGASTIGDHVTVATESLVLDRDVAANTTYIGNPRSFQLKPRMHPEAIWRT
jgi:serine O-acetyltransferase